MINQEIDLNGQKMANYQIVEKLGRGGMATVYKAHELSLNRFVALKVLSSQLSHNEEYIKRFQREAQAAAALNSPHIVQIYAIGEENHIHYFAMEYIKGESLAEKIKKEGPLSVEQAVPILIQVASALKQAHKINLVHRDIKPSNIMITHEGVAKVADFGIAHIMDAQTKLTQEGSIIGTPEYLSPEQCEAKPIDGRSDIYSLGVTFYEMLSGRTPYTADTPVSMLMKIVQGNFVPLNQVNAKIPAAIQKIVEKMMQTDINKRYQNIDELLKELDSVKDQIVPVAEPVAEQTSLLSATPEAAKKGNKGLFIFIIFLLIITGGASAWYFLIHKKSPEPVKNETVTEQTMPSDPKSQSLETKDANESNQAVSDTSAPAQTPTQENSVATNISSEGKTPETGTAETEKINVSPAKKIGSESSIKGTVQGNQTNVVSTTRPSGNMKTTVTQPPLPPAKSIMIQVTGNNETADMIESYAQEFWQDSHWQIIDNPPANRNQVARISRFEILISVKHLGSTTLQHYGSSTEMYTVACTAKILDTKTSQLTSGPITQTIEYTTLNAAENLKEGIANLMMKLQQKMKNR